MGEVSRWLPDVPREQASPKDLKCTLQRNCVRRHHAANKVVAQCWVDQDDAEYLMRAWNLKNRSQLVRAALRHLLRQTQRGLERLDGPPEGYD